MRPGGMEKEMRARMLRERFKAKCCFAYVASGKPVKKARVVEPLRYQEWAVISPGNARRQKWLEKPLPGLDRTVRPKRNAGEVATLTKIAEKAPRKLEKKVRKYAWQATDAE